MRLIGLGSRALNLMVLRASARSAFGKQLSANECVLRDIAETRLKVCDAARCRCMFVMVIAVSAAAGGDASAHAAHGLDHGSLRQQGSCFRVILQLFCREFLTRRAGVTRPNRVHKNSSAPHGDAAAAPPDFHPTPLAGPKHHRRLHPTPWSWWRLFRLRLCILASFTASAPHTRHSRAAGGRWHAACASPTAQTPSICKLSESSLCSKRTRAPRSPSSLPVATLAPDVPASKRKYAGGAASFGRRRLFLRQAVPGDALQRFNANQCNYRVYSTALLERNKRAAHRH